MTAKKIDAILEELSEAIVFTEPDDMSALADLHTRLQEVAQSPGKPGRDLPGTAALAAARLVELIILEEAGDATASLEAVGETVSALLAVHRDGRSIEEVQFPEALHLGPAGEASSGGTFSALSLPANVDETILGDFLARQGGVMEEMESLILELERGEDEESFDGFRRLIHTIKGEAGLLGLTAVERLCHATEDALDANPAQQMIDSLLLVKDWLTGAFEAYSEGQVPSSDPPDPTPGAQAAAPETADAAAQAESSAELPPSEPVPAAQEPSSALDASFGAAIEAVSGVEADDMPALASIHTSLGELAEKVEAQGRADVKSALDVAAATIEDIILEEAARPDAALLAIRDSLASLQKAIREGSALEAAAPAPEPTPPEPEAPVEETVSDEPVYLSEGDADLLKDFVAEAMEHLDASDVHLLTLESDPDDKDSIDAVFRAFHTIKGVAGFLTLPNVQSLAHEAETLLDKVRKRELVIQGAVIDVIFESVDTLKQLMADVTTALVTGGPLAPLATLPTLLAAIKTASAGGEPLEEKPVPEDLVLEGDKRLGDLLVESGAADPEGVEAALEKQKDAPKAPKLGEILVGDAAASSADVDKALAIQEDDPTQGKIGDILVSSGSANEEDVQAALDKQSEAPAGPKLGEILVRSGEAGAKDVAKALRTQKAVARQTVHIKEAVKVDADRLDNLVDLIGELVIAESMVALSPELQDGVSQALGRHINQLDKITRELQEMGMTLRMVPVRATFHKMARLVRDLAKKADKKVDFVMVGEDTELDKTVVDKIGDPLVHMVRNAVDHGLESDPEQRRSAGKPRAGRIELRAFHRGGNIYIEISDDGRGLDREAILAKARERGLIHEEDTLEDREIWNLIFEPGFSTAKAVTDVSGRGVGMDVVRRNIEQLRGRVEIDSREGSGTTFSIRLPLTLAIIEGMVIRCGGQRFVLPTISVQQLMRPDDADYTSAFKTDEMLMVQGSLVPFYRLATLFDIPDAITDREKGVVIVVENDEQLIALLVDEVLGQQQTVIKPLGETFGMASGVVGGAIMPDGTVGLILDASGLITLAHETPRKPSARSLTQEISAQKPARRPQDEAP